LDVASEKLGMANQIIEKDFWVCWLLEKLFSIATIRENLTFKGGTSLSKVYSVINRFSEDIDISIEKSFFGFIGDKDPEKVGSKKRNELLKELTLKCQSFVKDELIRLLEDKIKVEISGDWNVSLDENDPDQQTILFHYPLSTTGSTGGYIRPSVKIEIGARSEHWPVSNKHITSYLKQSLSDKIHENPNEVKVLNLERTFWEKATILHMYAHYPPEKSVPLRQSRHYCDFCCLIESPYISESEKLTDLLERVAHHKSIYFRAGWAQYETAKRGSLKLIPERPILKSMEDDYKKMNEMFIGSPPTWSHIIEVIAEFERRFNKADS
jgi:hypothetical protein